MLFVGSVYWFKAIMLGGRLIGKAGVLLMIAVFGKLCSIINVKTGLACPAAIDP